MTKQDIKELDKAIFDAMVYGNGAVRIAKKTVTHLPFDEWKEGLEDGWATDDDADKPLSDNNQSNTSE